jgi:hypothetical protein
MQRRLPWRWWPLLLVALVAACEDDKAAPGTTPTPDSGTTADATTPDTTTPPAGDGGLAPCLDRPTDLDMPPSGQLPCDLLSPDFVAP